MENRMLIDSEWDDDESLEEREEREAAYDRWADDECDRRMVEDYDIV